MDDLIFETERLQVRRWRTADLPDLQAVYGDADAMRWVGAGQPITEDECRRWLAVTQANYEKRGYGMFAVASRAEGGVIGFCGIVHPESGVSLDLRAGVGRVVAMGLLTFSLNVTLDGCVDHRAGIADEETHAFFTRIMDEGGAMLWGRVTYEMMESTWPAVARGDVEAPPALRAWAVQLEAKPKYVVSSTRTDFPWTNSHHLAGDLRASVQQLKDATPAGVLLGSGKLANELDRLDLIDEYRFLVHPRIAGHGPTLYQSGLLSARRLELVSATALRNGAIAVHYRRARGAASPIGPR